MKNEVKRLMSSHGEARIMIYVLVIYDDSEKKYDARKEIYFSCGWPEFLCFI